MLARGQAGSEASVTANTKDIPGDDLERICDIIMTDLPPTMVTDALSAGTPFGRTANSLAELLDSLTGLLDDITDERPALCQVFISLLSTIPSMESLSENDRGAVTKMQARAASVTTISPAALQEIQLLAAPSDPDMKWNDSGAAIKTDDQRLQGEESIPSLPSSPDPWATTILKPICDSAAINISKIGAPPYITFLVQNALETSWNPTPGSRMPSLEDSSDMPDVYKRIVYTAPEVSSRPLTFIYHLVSASFGLLISSIDDLQLRAVREEQQSTSMMDSTDEVMLNLNGAQSGEMSDNLKNAKIKEIIARDGWRTWMWCFSGLIRVLQYWKAISNDLERGVFARQWQLPVSNMQRKSVFS